MIVKDIINVPCNETLDERLEYYVKVYKGIKKSRAMGYQYPQFEDKMNPDRLPRDDY